MKAGIVQQIFNDHFDDYRKGRVLDARQWRAAWDIMTCRTPEKGYHVDECPNGDYRVILPNSCKNRSCPQCGSTETQLWLERRRSQALDCPYFHVVITISHDLHGIWRANRKLFTGHMMRSAWGSLQELLSDCRWLGGLPGVIAVFQSWDDDLREHCHLHLIVTAGGLNPDGRWVSARKDLLVYTPVLASKFRGKFLDSLRQGFKPLTKTGRPKPSEQLLSPPPGKSVQQCLNLLNKLGRVRWHADIEPAYEHANGVFKYVGRYIRRGPISEKRIVGYDGDTVTIAYAHPEKHEQLTFKLDAQTFIRRLLDHVPEKGTHLVRSYGLFHPTQLDKLNLARERLGQKAYAPGVDRPTTIELLRQMFPDLGETRCPHCGEILRTVFVYRGGHTEPWRLAA
ncbi:transposase [Desulfosarcina cetonica]|uniref:IS91 family transposase n=1 Tax=Desulfosarcina cetonica TaxID=90730 RepID=UPI0006D084F6|nr:transposase [Desulfosarcina cetonica]VTR68025.1 transposase [Desulfosarcina cetonica]